MKLKNISQHHQSSTTLNYEFKTIVMSLRVLKMRNWILKHPGLSKETYWYNWIIFPTFVENIAMMRCSNLGALIFVSLPMIAKERRKHMRACYSCALIHLKYACMYFGNCDCLSVVLNIHAIVNVSIWFSVMV